MINDCAVVGVKGAMLRGGQLPEVAEEGQEQIKKEEAFSHSCGKKGNREEEQEEEEQEEEGTVRRFILEIDHGQGLRRLAKGSRQVDRQPCLLSSLRLMFEAEKKKYFPSLSLFPLLSFLSPSLSLPSLSRPVNTSYPGLFVNNSAKNGERVHTVRLFAACFAIFAHALFVLDHKKA